MTDFPGIQGNAVIAASAGTGKTYVLTQVFLARVLGVGVDAPVRPEALVATTFSRAAAAELRARIEGALSAVAEAQDTASVLACFDDRLSATAEAVGLVELRRRAREALEEIPAATIDTLHGLAARLLRQHAVQLDITPEFAILEESAAFEEAERAIDDALANALEHEQSRRQAERFIDACYGLDGARSTLLVVTAKLDEEGFEADDIRFGSVTQQAVLLFDRLHELVTTLANSAEPDLAEPARNVLAHLPRPGRLPTVSPELAGNLEQLFEIRSLKRFKQFPAWLDFHEFRSQIRGSNNAARALALTQLARCASEMDADESWIAELLFDVSRRIDTGRRARGALSFGDLMRLARKALADHPALAAQAAARIELLLVDEFQDTSRVQRDLLLLLRERPESREARRPGAVPAPADIARDGLVLVGDRKQSIYGFRGADVAVFTELAAALSGEAAREALDLAGVTAGAEPVAEFFTQNVSRRSTPPVVEAINAIAGRDFPSVASSAFEIRYAASEALRLPPDATGDCGRVTIVEDHGAVPDDAAPIVATADNHLRVAHVAASLAQRLSREGVALRDIALLARRRATMPLLELALSRLQLPYVVAGRALYRMPEIRDVIAALRLAVDPLDRHALAVVARGPFGGLSDPLLAHLCDPSRGLRPVSEWGAVRIDNPAWRAQRDQLAERLDQFVQLASRLSPRDAIQHASEVFELEQVATRLPRGAVRLANVSRLMDIAASRGGGLPAFVRFVDRQIAIDADETEAAIFSDEDEAVRILTIHASKGLAFPHVILVDLETVERPSVRMLDVAALPDPTLVMRHKGEAGPIWTPLLRQAQDVGALRATAERQRLSYVAMTRAADHLAFVLPEAEKPRANSLHATLAGLLEDGTLDDIARVTRLSAHDLLEAASVEDAPDIDVPADAITRPSSPQQSTISVGTTALRDFAICPRRFRLLHVCAIDEPTPVEPTDGAHDSAAGEWDFRALGVAAHAVLETCALDGSDPIDQSAIAARLQRLLRGPPPDEVAGGIVRFLKSAYVADVARTARAVHRELAVTVPIAETQANRATARQLGLFDAELPSSERPPQPTLLLRCTLDVALRRSDGAVDVLDYKLASKAHLDRYRFQLETYRLAAMFRFETEQVRVGLVPLLAERPEPSWLERPRHPHLLDLAARLAASRWSDDWPHVARSRCRRARCGFESVCYGNQQATR